MIKDLFKSIFRGFGYTLGKIILFIIIGYIIYYLANKYGLPKGVIYPI